MSHQNELSWIKEIRVVGWDLDGTLYPADRIPAEVINEFKWKKLQVIHPSMPIDEIKKEYERLYSQLGAHTRALTAMGLNGEQFFTGVWDELQLQNYLHPDGEVVKLVRGLNQRGYGQFVLANSNRLDQIEKKLRFIGFDPANDFLTLVSTVGMGVVKPDAKPYLEAKQRVGEKLGREIEVNEILYIGDRESTDVAGAKRAGMRAGIVRGSSALADVSFRDWEDIGRRL